jgi:CheY-like chemotaxis protein
MAHVLLIDDDPGFLPVQVRQALPDHLITSVTTGAAAIEQIRALSPDVALLDVLVSRQSGLAVYEQIPAIDALRSKAGA